MLEPYWSAVQTYTGQEQRAVDNLLRQGFEAFTPQMLDLRPGRPSSWRATFPGYAFAEIRVDIPWGAIRSTFGVVRLLTYTGEDALPYPQRVPDPFITTLRRCVEVDPRGRALVRTGAVVHVTRGPFIGQSAVVSFSLGDRLKLLFQILNRDVEVEFRLADVDVNDEDLITAGYMPAEATG